MTTVAYRNGIIAADSFAHHQYAVVSRNECKVFRSSDGRIFGIGGTLDLQYQVVRALMGCCPMPEVGEDDGGTIEIKKNREIWFHKGKIGGRIKAGFYAIGTGAHFALGAMQMGASAAEAVKVASRFDVFSGGRVQVRKL